MLAVAGVFAGLFALIGLRAVDLAVFRGPELARMAAAQHRARIELTPRRGSIVDRHGDALALSLDVPSVYVRPRELDAPDSGLAALAAALHMPVKALRAKVGGRQPFVWLKRQAPPREAEAVQRLGLRGVYTVAEGRRFYPHNGLAAHVLGVGVDSGLEDRAPPDRVIRGQARGIEADRDAHGQAMFTAGVQAMPTRGAAGVDRRRRSRTRRSASSRPASRRRAPSAARRSSSIRPRARSSRSRTSRRTTRTSPTPAAEASGSGATASATARSPTPTSPARRSRRSSPRPPSRRRS
jgi:hypothetical protein